MPTRQARLVLASAAASVLAGRVFGILELFALAAGLTALVVLAVARTALRRPRLEVRRRVDPSQPSVGEPARVELVVQAPARTPAVDLWEPVEGRGGAALRITPMRRGEVAVATYRLPTDRRGRVRLGPTSVETGDAFGLARTKRWIAPVHDVLVRPRWQLVELPAIGGGAGPLSQALARRAMGHVSADEFHALRDYVPGDDLRRVHWRQSARRDDLVVRQTDPSPRLVLTVVHDLHANQYTAPGFERAVSAVASLAGSAAHHRRPLRLITTDSDEHVVDELHLAAVMEHLALVEPSSGRIPPPRRHHADGLHVVVVVGGVLEAGRVTALGAAAGGVDAGVAVGCERGGRVPSGWFAVDASLDGGFAEAWSRLVGTAPTSGRVGATA